MQMTDNMLYFLDTALPEEREAKEAQSLEVIHQVALMLSLRKSPP